MAITQPALHQEPALVAAARVVCVDLDGTLVAADLLWESYLEFARRHPVQAFRLLAHLVKGKAAFKRQVASAAALDPRQLPYRERLLELLMALRAEGASLVLATAADERYAHAVAGHLGIFADVIASDGYTNLSGERKAAALVSRYGAAQFDYIGNAHADVPVWRVAARAMAVAAPAGVLRRASAGRAVQDLGSRPRSLWASLLLMARPHQWVKNLLVFVPLLTSHTIFQFERLAAGVLTWLAFSLCASSVYLVNDAFDIQADRAHARKKARPLAAGDVGIPVTLVAAALLATLGLGIAATIAWPLAAVVVGYIAVSSAYSMALKRQAVTDVFVLTALYVLRIVAGGQATGVELSSWLLGFALFVFLSLACVKRYAEVTATPGWIPGRGYHSDDAQWMHTTGICAGFMAVVVLALYVTAPEVAVLYSRPSTLWFLCPLLLFWLNRLWFRTSRRQVHDDPVVEALRDPQSYIVGAAAMAIMLLAV